MDNIQVPQASPETQKFLKNKQIFMSAIFQAVSYGMKSFEGCEGEKFDQFMISMKDALPTEEGITVVDHMVRYGGYLTILFSFSFANAFFGEGKSRKGIEGQFEYEVYQDYWVSVPSYLFHLSQMAIAEDRLEYLVPFLKPIEPVKEWR